jgi:hypothetical protein
MSITIKEFKAWMKGVEDMHGENWSPNKNQWKKIREKLEQLDEDTQAPQYNMNHYTPPPQQYIANYSPMPFETPVHVEDAEGASYLNGDKPSFI